jgi:hypothetical protein
MTPHGARTRTSWKALRPAGLLLFFSLFGSIFMGALPTAGQTRFAVIAPPWHRLTDAAALVSDAGGDIVDAGGMPNIIIAHSNDPAFVGALYRHGAWLVMGSSTPGGCLGDGRPTTPTRQQRPIRNG